jgi:hypothetical protein
MRPLQRGGADRAILRLVVESVLAVLVLVILGVAWARLSSRESLRESAARDLRREELVASTPQKHIAELHHDGEFVCVQGSLRGRGRPVKG